MDSSGMPQNVEDAKKILERDSVSNGVMNRAYAIALLDLLARVEGLEAQAKKKSE